MNRSSFILRIKQVLLRRRDAIRRTLASELALLARRYELEPVGDPCDEAKDTADDEVLSSLAQTESREMRAIEKALARIRDGHYGICEDCDARIPLGRLQAVPYATLCIRCQRESEKYGRSERRIADWSTVTDMTDEDDWRQIDDLKVLAK